MSERDKHRSLALSSEFAARLLSAMGVPTDRVSAVEIVMRVRDPVRVRVEFILESAAMQDLLATVCKYRLQAVLDADAPGIAENTHG